MEKSVGKMRKTWMRQNGAREIERDSGNERGLRDKRAEKKTHSH